MVQVRAVLTKQKMQSIPTFRAAHLYPHLSVLQKMGAPIDHGLRIARLPSIVTGTPDLYLPLFNTLNFLTSISQSQGIDDLGFRAVENQTVANLSDELHTALCQAPTLNLALQYFIKLASLEDSSVKLWTNTETNMLNAHSTLLIPCDQQALRLSEWGQNMMLIAMVRMFAGKKWSPIEMAFQSSLPIGNYVREKFPNTRFLTGQKSAWVSLPISLLSLPPRKKCFIDQQTSTENIIIKDDASFPASLIKVIKSYLSDGYPTLELAAELAGTSSRTLQRHLKQYDLSYSNLVKLAQYEMAIEMLKDSCSSISDIAGSVGYGDSSNFSRAFKKIAGTNPQQYRKSL